MLTDSLLFLTLAILAILSIYVCGYLVVAIQFLFSRVQPKDSAAKSGAKAREKVVVFVPAYNEGDALVDTVETLLHQDYAGPLHVEILIEDQSDSSFRALNKRYRIADGKVYKRGAKTLSVNLTGLRRKNAKINFALDQLDATYVAFLDADHRADPRWISRSIDKLIAEKADAVQSRRGPLDARKLFQFWDSAENHIGNEVLNTVFSRWRLNSFFTGTTCLFKASVFESLRFSESITEDTYLSYDLLCAGHKIAYNGAAGSYEEVAPEVGTYLARRRRWSSGHNQSFFDHLPAILSGPLNIFRKFQLLMHGAYFLLPSLIVVLINCLGIYFFLQFTDNIRLLSIFLSLGVGLYLSHITSNRFSEYAVNLLFSFLWVFPQITTACVFIYKIAGDELFYQLLAFPYARDLTMVHVLLLLLPLSLLFVGSWKFKRPSLGFVLLYLPTFPLILFLDIFSLYLGFVDYILGRSVWGKISRSNTVGPNALPGAVAAVLTTQKKAASRYLYFLAIPATLLSAVLVNDLLVFDSNCGHPKYLFFKPLLFKSSPDAVLDIRIGKTASPTPGAFTLIADVKVITDNPEGMRIEYSLRKEELHKQALSPQASSFQIKEDVPMGFDTVDFNVSLRGKGTTCSVKRAVSTTFKEVQNNRLFVNGEEFPIKGVIPSFRTAHIDISLREGLEQIKELGANTIRVYHAPTDELLALANELSLMIVVQPDESTWANIDMGAWGADKELASYYDELIEDTEGNPYILIDNIGNELEIAADSKEAPKNIKKALTTARESEGYRFPLSYSTYAIYDDYPVDVMAINMLDTGDTYWDQGLALVRSRNMAFYASEFGGFVAFFERVEPLIRAKRVHDYWERLGLLGSSGAIFFQSHDNWAQPVVVGYNDPFNPEQPDDERGLWDHDNRKKPVHDVLKNLYADVKLSLDTAGSKARLAGRNIRSYALQDLVIEHEGVRVFEGNVAANSEFHFEPPTWSESADHEFRMSYTSHRGLLSAYTVTVVDPRFIQSPYFLDEYISVTSRGEDRLEIELYADDQLDFYLPTDWQSYEVNGERKVNQGLNTYSPAQASFVECTNTDWAQTPPQWNELGDRFENTGVFYVRCRIPVGLDVSEYSFVVEGVGSTRIDVLASTGAVLPIETHSYRENRIPMSRLPGAVDAEGGIVFRVDRQFVEYIAGNYTPSGVPIRVRLKPPRLEKIHKISLSR